MNKDDDTIIRKGFTRKGLYDVVKIPLGDKNIQMSMILNQVVVVELRKNS